MSPASPARWLPGRPVGAPLNFTENAVDPRRGYDELTWRQLTGIRSAVDPPWHFAANHPVPRLYEDGRPTWGVWGFMGWGVGIASTFRTRVRHHEAQPGEPGQLLPADVAARVRLPRWSPARTQRYSFSAYDGP